MVSIPGVLPGAGWARRSLIGTVALGLGVGAVLVLVLLAFWEAGYNVPRLTKDANAVSGEANYTGSLAIAGVAMAACAVCLSVFALAVSGRVRWRYPDITLIAIAVLMTIVAVDDALIVREYVRNEFNGGKALYAVGYGFIGAAWVVVARPWRTPAGLGLLVSAVAFLAGSVLVDLAARNVSLSRMGQLGTIEDGCKLAGLGLLLAWTAVVSSKHVRQRATADGRVAAVTAR